MATRRMTLGPVSQNAMNIRNDNSHNNTTSKRMSVGAGAPRMSIGGQGHTHNMNTGGNRRMSVGTGGGSNFGRKDSGNTTR